MWSVQLFGYNLIIYIIQKIDPLVLKLYSVLGSYSVLVILNEIQLCTLQIKSKSGFISMSMYFYLGCLLIYYGEEFTVAILTNQWRSCLHDGLTSLVSLT